MGPKATINIRRSCRNYPVLTVDGPRQFPIMDWSLYVTNIYVCLSVISNIRLSLTMVPPLYEFHFDFNIRQAVERFLTLGCPQ